MGNCYDPWGAWKIDWDRKIHGKKDESKGTQLGPTVGLTSHTGSGWLPDWQGLAAGVPMLQNLWNDFRQKCQDLSIKLLPYAQVIAHPSTKTPTKEGKGEPVWGKGQGAELLVSLLMGEGRKASRVRQSLLRMEMIQTSAQKSSYE